MPSYNSWRGTSPVQYGILGGLTQGIAQGGQNFANMYLKSSQLASEVAHQKAEEAARNRMLDIQEKQLAQQKELAGQELLHKKYISEGKTPPASLTPPLPEEISARREYETDLDRINRMRRERAEEMTGTRFVQQDIMPRAISGLRATETDIARAKQLLSPVAEQYGTMTPEEQQEALDVGKTGVRAEVLRSELEAERAQPVGEVRHVGAPTMESLRSPGWSERSAEGDEAVRAALGVRELINADDEYKAQVEITKAEMQKLYDLEKQGKADEAEMNRTIQRGKDSIAAAYASGVGRQKAIQRYETEMGTMHFQNNPGKFKSVSEAIANLKLLTKPSPAAGTPIDKMKLERFKGLIRDLSAGRKQQADPSVQMMYEALGLPPSTTVEEVESKLDAMMGEGAVSGGGALSSDRFRK